MDIEAVVSWLGALLGMADIQARAFVLCFARVLPAMLLVPAFGLRALPGPARLALGLSLAASIAPAAIPSPATTGALGLQIAAELFKGLPIALTAATALWVATMVGGVIDDLRTADAEIFMPHVEAGATPMGALFSMLAALAFLRSGGPSRIASALSVPDLMPLEPFTRAAGNLAGGIQIAVAIAAPVVVVKIVIELALALVSRAARPMAVDAAAQTLRSLLLLGLTAVLLERVLWGVIELSTRVP
ncbi:MAG TPA: flagellar biosynthetic protein FliR [Polyangiaceae bacterium]|nr:flagellar biosynthetic protein FliR [Polyangiaceae bacterium]